ncbi:hypothetical protein AAE478_003119 [Parahypoxylon ruwenzoriense]
MKFSNELLCGLASAGLALGGSNISTTHLRNIVYFDQYHATVLPGRNVTAGITHVIMAFANSSLFAAETAGDYEPFMPLANVRAMFDNSTQLGIAVGGWGDTAGFSAGARSEQSRRAYARNLAAMVGKLGFDFVDVDWEYPGGNGADYKQIPNTNKTTEITTFPLLLREIKAAIAPKPLSIAAPGLSRDMIAYTCSQAPSIFAAVDMVNVMTFDMAGRRDTATAHHSSLAGSLAAVRRYMELGLPPAKINLGLAYYAKFFRTAPNATCADTPVGCPIVRAENDDGSDAGTSGAVTFEKANVFPPPAPAVAVNNLTTSVDGTCGAAAGFTCAGVVGGRCCSAAGFCGSTAAYCGTGCQRAFGDGCSGPDVAASFAAALAGGRLDACEGAMWYWDAGARLFWTWDTAELMRRKIAEIVRPLGLGGVMAWSLGEDTADWSHVRAVTRALGAGSVRGRVEMLRKGGRRSGYLDLRDA